MDIDKKRDNDFNSLSYDELRRKTSRNAEEKKGK